MVNTPLTDDERQELGESMEEWGTESLVSTILEIATEAQLKAWLDEKRRIDAELDDEAE